jgi:hypothetical protein
MSHALKLHPRNVERIERQRKRRGSAIQWPSFQGTAILVGTSISKVSVYVDATLGNEAKQNAADLLADADRIVGANAGYFGAGASGAVNVLLFALGGATDGTGGADHMACDFVTGGNIEVCVSYGNSMRCSALFEAEYSECCMNGQLCGLSTGEALSRWCAMEVSNNALSDFASAPVWDQDGRPNFVDTADQTDTNYDSIGCGMAFLSWLVSLGHPLNTIAPEMVKLGDSGTLADLYQALTGDAKTNAWSKFITALEVLSGVTSDDPFYGSPPPPPLPPSSTVTFKVNGTVTLAGSVASG